MSLKTLNNTLRSSEPSNAVLFIRSFSVSAFIGLSYIVVLEIAQAMIGYERALAHSIVAFSFYVLGIFLNYAMQKKLVFSADNSPIFSFFIYSLINALFVSSLAGLAYSSASMHDIFGQFIEGASTAIALLIVSPIAFVVFRKLFKQSAESNQ